MEGGEELGELGLGLGGVFGLDRWAVGPHAGLFYDGFVGGLVEVVGELVEDGVCSFLPVRHALQPIENSDEGRGEGPYQPNTQQP